MEQVNFFRDWRVQTITLADAEPWLLKKHYAHRLPSCITHSFGIFDQNLLLRGVCTFGVPASPNLCFGICGHEWVDKVLELNRLCIEEGVPKNTSSFFVSSCLSMLPKPTICVSYADSGQSHIGYIYQATNFLFTGMSSIHDQYMVNGIPTHDKTLSDRGITAVKKWARENDIEVIPGSAKYRYIIFLGSKTQKKLMRSLLKYKVLPYPKGEVKRYDSGGSVPTQSLLF